MTLLDELPRLAGMHLFGPMTIGEFDMQDATLRNAAPRLLAVARKFQKGDSELLKKAMACDKSLSAHDFVAFLRRMAEAASMMEAEG